MLFKTLETVAGAGHYAASGFLTLILLSARGWPPIYEAAQGSTIEY